MNRKWRNIRSTINKIALLIFLVSLATINKGIIINASVDAKLTDFYISNSMPIAGRSYIITASGASTNGILYKFWMSDLSTGKWYVLQDYSDKSSVTWIPQLEGKYELVVHAKDKYSTKEEDDYKYQYIDVNSMRAKLNSFGIDSQALYASKSYTISANGTSEDGVLYKFWLADLSTGKWNILQDYSVKSSVTWTPQVKGKYELVVHAKDKYSAKEEDDYKYQYINVNEISAKLYNFSLDNTTPYAGKSYIMTANGTSKNGILYKFWLADLSTGKWSVLQEYSEKNSFTWTPQMEGKYEIVVHAKDKYSGKEEDDYKYQYINVNCARAKLNGFGIDNDTLFEGKSYAITANGTCQDAILYKFWLADLSTGKWSVLQEYSEKNSYTWTPQVEGKYEIVVHAKGKYSGNEEDDYKYQYVNVNPYKSHLTSFNIAKDNSKSDKVSYLLSAQGYSPNKIEYRFWIYDFNQNNWQIIQDYSENYQINWEVPHDGYYRVAVHSKDSMSSSDCEDYKYIDVNFVNGMPCFSGTASLNNLTIDYKGQSISQYFPNNQYNITASATSGVKPVYRFWVADVLTNTWTLLQDYDYNNVFKWTPSYSGRFEIVVEVKDVTSKQDYQDYKYFYLNICEVKANSNNYGINEIVNNTDYNYTFYDAVNAQISTGAVYDNNGSWDPASRDQIEYYLNPSNFINGSYGKYQFLKLSYSDCVTANDVNLILPSSTNNVLYGKGSTFLQGGKTYGVNPLYLVSHALLETANGTSALANGVVIYGKKYYNMFGIHAYDSDPIGSGSQYAYSMGWDTPEKAIIGGAKWIYDNYLSYGQDTLYKMRWNPSNPGKHQYATDVRWAYNQIYRIKNLADKLSNPHFIYDIPIYK